MITVEKYTTLHALCIIRTGFPPKVVPLRPTIQFVFTLRYAIRNSERKECFAPHNTLSMRFKVVSVISSLEDKDKLLQDFVML